MPRDGCFCDSHPCGASLSLAASGRLSFIFQNCSQRASVRAVKAFSRRNEPKRSAEPPRSCRSDVCNPAPKRMSESGQSGTSNHVRCDGSFFRKRPRDMPLQEARKRADRNRICVFEEGATPHPFLRLNAPAAVLRRCGWHPRSSLAVSRSSNRRTASRAYPIREDCDDNWFAPWQLK